MGFGKRGGNLPAKIRDLNFEHLHNAQMRVLAEWLGCRPMFSAFKHVEERRAFLKERCLENELRAQEGYDIIVLQKQAVGAGTNAVPADMEKRMYEVLTDVVVRHKDEMGERAFLVVSKAADTIKKQLEAYAKDQVREAAEKRAPILIKEAGKVRKVKGVLPPEFKRMVELASARIPVMLVGPAGCGKTFLCEKLAEALNLDFSDQSCSEGMSESVFNGLLLPIGKGGEFKHVTSPFMDRYESGGIMLLDEIDAGDPNLFTYINKAVANKSYTVAQRWTRPVVNKHEDFVLVAAANTFGNGADAMYVGRNQLDAATLDRFKVGLVTMDYSHDVEASLAPADLCEWAWSIREQIAKLKLRRIMSTRVIKDLGTMTKMYDWQREQWEHAYFAGWSPAERALVATAVQAPTPRGFGKRPKEILVDDFINREVT